ncbi:MAG: S8 family serine peptidase [Planctomycetes bacterium]|nr:S8 family serine peptidase [Planctomycetota bacterium]
MRPGPLASTAFACALALGPAALAQAQGPAAPAEAESAPLDVVPSQRADRLWVKLREGTGAVCADGRLTSRTGVDLGRIAGIFAAAERAAPLIPLAPELLDRWHREACERLPEGVERPGHLGLWFVLGFENGAAAERARVELAAEPLVEEADFEYVPIPQSRGDVDLRAMLGACAPTDIPPPTPDLTSHQGYVEPAPAGHGFAALRSVVGGRGETVGLVHVEQDWIVDHEDLDGITLQSFLGGPTPGTGEMADHGTAVLGILNATRNDYGVTGVADQSTVRLLSWEIAGNYALAIAQALAASAPGDAILIIFGINLAQTKPRDVVPAEFVRVVFDVILTATTQGVVVVEAATNGDNDLDDPRFGRVFDRNVRDSGAIVVGASEGSTFRRAGFTNYGSRCDVSSWGGEVGSTGYGNLFFPNRDRRQSYVDGYGGTSAAGAIIGGAALVVQGIAKRQLGRVLTPRELRDALAHHGTPTFGEIGPRPDLVATVRALGVPDGLELDRAELRAAEQLAITMRGPGGGAFGLVASTGATSSTSLGWNRPLHLDPVVLLPIGGFALGAQGIAQATLVMPNDPGLADVDLFFQGVVVGTGGQPQLTNSATVWLR